ncbi:TDT family transporter [Streptomyces candidus]|uniref:C4-dicarboxylate transporter/malic acid transport protein n=1 Tax=Streptomyces candidus TaxID=67283 RepID=A0A7X0LPV8_9ACTN|nr:TDT family transporter [Streptomyces candidus]MBB6436410.1 C4-dicarboxylate transporter/malic acid transport protein [Streptomyces candidus]GHH48828.1 C4-dicarboxylate ABC transporter [Streptomyces candidus]
MALTTQQLLPRTPERAAPVAPSPQLRHLGPHWYATVMGTAVLATAGSALPYRSPVLHAALTASWVLAALVLFVLVTARGAHWHHHRDQARAHLLDPAVAPFYGCLAMAVLAVGGGAATVGQDVLGPATALGVASVLWSAGTVLALLAAAVVPYLMVVRHRIEGVAAASPVWLLPLVAPMVSAALGPQLMPHLPQGQPRTAMLLACYALFGLSLLATLLILPLVLARLLVHGPLPLPLTPTLFLVLGPLGQSTTAVNQLADVAPGAIGATYAHGFQAFAVVYGVPVLGFALLWLALAVAMVVRGARAGMPFAMTWWGFTFPVGTCVTGAAGLARHTGLDALLWLATALFVLLVAAWAVTAFRTVRGLLSGALLAGPRPARPALG